MCKCLDLLVDASSWFSLIFTSQFQKNGFTSECKKFKFISFLKYCMGIRQFYKTKSCETPMFHDLTYYQKFMSRTEINLILVCF